MITVFAYESLFSETDSEHLLL